MFSCECKQRSKSIVCCSGIENKTCMHLSLVVNNNIFHFENARCNGQSFLFHSFPFTAKVLRYDYINIKRASRKVMK